MKNFRFYVEYPMDVNPKNFSRKDLGKHSGNCLAVMTDTKQFVRDCARQVQVQYDCIGAIYFDANAQCAGSSCYADYLTKSCKRVSEKQAREIHPNLFAILDQK